MLQCTNKASALTNEGCHQCCGGTVHHSSLPCIFPFTLADPATGATAQHATCLVSSTVNTSAGVPLRWCPTAVDATGKPQGNRGECSGHCVQADYVGAAALASGCEPTCPAAGTPPSPLTLRIDATGWGGPAGFVYGKPYKLVLYTSNSPHVRTEVALYAAGGKQLVQARFAREECVAALQKATSTSRRALLPQRKEDGEEHAGAAAVAEGESEGVQEDDRHGTGGGGHPHDDDGSRTAWWKRRLAASQVIRRSNWLSQLNRQGAPIRSKEGEAARWNQRPVANAGPDVQCAEAVVLSGTRVYVQGGCDSASGSHVLRADAMRAELGSPFMLSETDFPLRLSVSYANASLRGEEAYSAQSNPELAPRIYVSFYTAELDTSLRYLLWIGVPILYVLLSCCCCCCLCFCCAVPSDAGGAHRAIREHELADLSTVQEPLDDDDDDDEFDSLRRKTRAVKGGSKSKKTARSKRKPPRGSIEDDIVPA